MNLRLLRGLAGATTLALLATALLSAPALAANGRLVYFGSPDGDGGGYNLDGSLRFGALTETSVSAGKRWATVLLVENRDNQTLNHVKIAGGTNADEKPDNPLFMPPTFSSLPSTASIATVIVNSGPAGTACDPDSGTGFECEIGALAAGASAEFLIIVNAPSTPDTYDYWFTGSWNEGWSSTGNNADYNFAVGSVDVKASNCGNGQASWFLGDEPVELDDGSTDPCGKTNAAINAGALGGNGGHATLAVDATFAVTCPAGYKCYGETVSVAIIEGESVPGGVKWTVTWTGTTTIKGVLHFADDYTTSGVFTPIAFTKTNKCTTTKTVNCWETLTPSPGKTKSVTAVFYTDSNGKGGGWI